MKKKKIEKKNKKIDHTISCSAAFRMQSYIRVILTYRAALPQAALDNINDVTQSYAVQTMRSISSLSTVDERL